MIQNQSNVMALDISGHEALSFDDLTVHRADAEISDSSLQQALRETESVWMKHHNHYAEVLDNLMMKVQAARGIV
ncbi:MAG: hypothetical protein KAQ67_05795 [Gammaproteobacteria bacterium]|nr:hypothetical protein [Gammaproteobacteria bacterium]